MNIVPLNVGAETNDGTGQNLRSGGIIINSNFAELDQRTTRQQAAIDQKVDKVFGKDLSVNDYTDADKAKVDTALQPVPGKGLSTNDYTSPEKIKLSGITDGATKNSADAQLRDRQTHTGTQPVSTITGLGSAALANTQVSPTDGAAGKVLLAGAFGLGGANTPVITNADTLLICGNYSTPTSWVGSPTAGDNSLNQGYLTVLPWAPAGGGNYVMQIWSGLYADDPIASEFQRVRVGGAWNAWRKTYSNANSVGAVSQASGKITGALIEFGSNANGEYWRFANGLQICKQSFVVSAPTTSQGTVFVSASPTATASYPMPFSATPNVTQNGAVNAPGGGWAAISTYPTATSWGNWVIYNPVSNTSVGTLWLTAIGRWI